MENMDIRKEVFMAYQFSQLVKNRVNMVNSYFWILVAHL